MYLWGIKSFSGKIGNVEECQFSKIIVKRNDNKNIA